MKKPSQATIMNLLTFGYEVLKKSEIQTYILDTQLLLQKVLKVDKLFILLNKETKVEEVEAEEFFKLLELRRKKMPIKYLLGYCEFMGLDFNVRPGVLIPRPDTEILVEKVIEIAKELNAETICDVCSGSGAIGVSIAYFLGNAKVYCSDLSDIACEVTEENAKKLLKAERLFVEKSDLLQFALEKEMKFDIIVSNPPYIKEEIISTLMEDVKNYEPHMALSGGEDGLFFYRKITEQSQKLLKQGGILAYEIGHDQGETVKNILIQNNFKHINIFQDLAGHDRVVIGTK